MSETFRLLPHQPEMSKGRPEILVQPSCSRVHLVPLQCTCRSFRFPHEITRHAELKADNDWRTWEERYRDSWEAYT